jgi:hypothetical protein
MEPINLEYLEQSQSHSRPLFRAQMSVEANQFIEKNFKPVFDHVSIKINFIFIFKFVLKFFFTILASKRNRQ